MTAPVQHAGLCTHTRAGKRPKLKYATAGDAAMALLEARDAAALSRGRPVDKVPCAYYRCDYCAGGYHLTHAPTPPTALQGPGPRRKHAT